MHRRGRASHTLPQHSSGDTVATWLGGVAMVYPPPTDLEEKKVSLELVVRHGRPQGGNTSLGVGVSRTGAVGRVIIDIPASVPYCVGDLP